MHAAPANGIEKPRQIEPDEKLAREMRPCGSDVPALVEVVKIIGRRPLLFEDAAVQPFAEFPRVGRLNENQAAVVYVFLGVGFQQG